MFAVVSAVFWKPVVYSEFRCGFSSQSAWLSFQNFNLISIWKWVSHLTFISLNFLIYIKKSIYFTELL